MAQMTTHHASAAVAAGSKPAKTSRLAGLKNLVSPPTIGTSHLSKLDRTVVTTALVMLPLGVIAILLAWRGASQTPFLFEQIPYLISGGLLGIGLLLAGGLLYMASWMARLAELQREESAEMRKVLVELKDELAKGGSWASAAYATAGSAAPAAGVYIATPTGTMFHAADCQVVTGRDDVVEVSGARLDKMKPCRMCDPLGEDV